MSQRYSVLDLLAGSERLHVQQEDIWRVDKILRGLIEKHFKWGSRETARTITPPSSGSPGVAVRRLEVWLFGGGSVHLKVEVSTLYEMNTLGLHDALPIQWVPVVHHLLSDIVELVASFDDNVSEALGFICQQGQTS
jgi:hypothetical protein